MASEPHPRRVIEDIKKRLRQQKISQSDLALALNTSQQAVSRRLSGEVDLTLTELEVVANVLGITIAELIGDPA